MSSGCGFPATILDEAGNVYEIFVDHGEANFGNDPVQPAEAMKKIK